MRGIFQLFTSAPNFNMMSDFTFSHCSGCIEHHSMVLICISLMNSDGEHLCTCIFLCSILVIHMSLVKSLCKCFVHFLTGFSVFLQNCESSLEVLFQILCQIYVLQIFSTTCGQSFPFLNGVACSFLENSLSCPLMICSLFFM